MAKEAKAELVRVDDNGVAHPIGIVASQRMRSRGGAYRLLPAPEHVVFMRFTGEDGRRDAEDGALVRLAGEISGPGSMCDIVALLAQTGWRGQLVVLDGGATRAIYFENGFVVGVQTSVEDERLGRVLYKFGAITAEEHETIMEKVEEGKRYGAAAVELGMVTQDKVFSYLAKQIEEVVYATLTVADGTFFFLDGFDDSRLVARQMLSANSLLMDAVTRMDEMRYFRERIRSSEHVPYRLSATPPALPATEYQATFDAIDGLRSIEQIGRITGRGEFATTKHVYALIQSKHVAVHPPKITGGLEAIVVLANEALRAVHRAADDNAEGAALRENLGSFAVGAGVYDTLLRDAGPNEEGLLDVHRVVENAALVAAGDDTERVLRQMLYDYVGFALFSAGSLLGEESEAAIGREVAPIVGRLQPQG